jgi:hypothetical protein
MRSDKLIRLGEESPPPRNYNNDGIRTAIADQVAEYLAKGGQIEEVPSHIGARAEFGFGIAPFPLRSDLRGRGA